jgi:hypothetical protein
MKNIHVLLTKPNDETGKGIWIEKTRDWCNIYITSAEEIKEGDWVKLFVKHIDKEWVHKVTKEDLLLYTDFNNEGSKIILTTDQDLINEGVQPIDDEFLEWFVKNPSCEYVEVSEDYFKPSNMVYGHDTEPYKIIIPKEEQKQHIIDMMRNDEELGLYDEPKTKCYCGHTTYCDCGPEQYFKDIEFPQQERPETLEDASWKYNPLKKLDGEFLRHAFKEGAKWQQERMYTEEDMINAFNEGQALNVRGKLIQGKEWFEQFKKK